MASTREESAPGGWEASGLARSRSLSAGRQTCKSVVAGGTARNCCGRESCAEAGGESRWEGEEIDRQTGLRASERGLQHYQPRTVFAAGRNARNPSCTSITAMPASEPLALDSDG